MKRLFLFFIILLSTSICFGLNCNSTNSGYWDNSSIWDCGASPSGEDIVRIINHTITIRNNAEAGNITLGNYSALKIESGYNLQVDYILLLNYSQLNISAGSNISFKDVSYAQLYLNHSSKLHLLGNTTDKAILKSVSETPTNYWKLEQASQDSLFYVRNGEIRQKAYSGAYGYVDWINFSIIKCSGNIFYHQTWWAPINLENIFINCSGQLIIDYSRTGYPIIYKNLTVYNGTDGLGTINLNYYPYIEFINSTFNESKVSGWLDGLFISKNHNNIEGNYLMYIGVNNAFFTKRITNKPTLNDNITIMRNRVKTGNYYYNLTINDSIQGKNINISDTGINITISNNQMLYASENITKAASSFINVVNGTIKNIIINNTKFTANGTGFILYDVLSVPNDKDTYRNVSVWINATNSTPNAIMTINATYDDTGITSEYSENNLFFRLYNGSAWSSKITDNYLKNIINNWLTTTFNTFGGIYSIGAGLKPTMPNNLTPSSGVYDTSIPIVCSGSTGSIEDLIRYNIEGYYFTYSNQTPDWYSIVNNSEGHYVWSIIDLPSQSFVALRCKANSGYDLTDWLTTQPAIIITGLSRAYLDISKGFRFGANENVTIAGLFSTAVGNAINGANCNASIYYPNGTLFLSNQTFNYVEGSEGIYQLQFMTSDVEGEYSIDVVCGFSGKSVTGLGTFQIREGTKFLIPISLAILSGMFILLAIFSSRKYLLLQVIFFFSALIFALGSISVINEFVKIEIIQDIQLLLIIKLTIILILIFIMFFKYVFEFWISGFKKR